tara:strand:- start:1943 stop:2116 length:174 start_codon:yes stop_codon:yes gene_type:complete
VLDMLTANKKEGAKCNRWILINGGCGGVLGVLNAHRGLKISPHHRVSASQGCFPHYY